MLDNGRAPLHGRLWFVSAVCASGFCVDLEVEDDDQLFRSITDVLGLGQIPCVLFDPRLVVPEARYYPAGLDEPNTYGLVEMGEAPVSLDRVFAIIDAAHGAVLVTPGVQPAHGSVWTNASRGWPDRKAESRVQFHLRFALQMKLNAHTIRWEEHLTEGRFDLMIELPDAHDRSRVTVECVLELKVLRSFTYSGHVIASADNHEAIAEGVTQAAAYREGKGARLSALCCFDMRTEDHGNSCFDLVRAQAESLAVALRRWYLYRSAREYRRAVAAALL
jgi:hypothetical protein